MLSVKYVGVYFFTFNCEIMSLILKVLRNLSTLRVGDLSMDRLTVTTDSHKLSLWIERIQEYRASNQKVSDWCTAHNVSIKSY
jgi:hypothetical protein